MKVIGLVPLDSRPCNTLWLEQFCNIAEYQLLMYPREKCGTLHQGAMFDEVLEWINDNVSQMDYLIISGDALFFGGLIQARKGLTDLDKIEKNKDFFQKIKKDNPSLKIYFFDTLMRTSITASNPKTALYWAKMNQYSRLVGEIHYFNRLADIKSLAELEKELPKEVIDEYLEARNRKHILNKMLIDFALNNVIDFLIILQEDSMPYGIQKIESDILRKKIAESKNILFYNGTDEGASLLVAKAMIDSENIKPNIYLHLPDPKSLNKIMLFEDQPCIENLQKMFQTVGLSNSNYEEADYVLAIYSEEANQDLNTGSYIEIKPLENQVYHNFISRLNDFIEEKKVCFVDLLFPNGGSPDILHNINFKKLEGYSAWNTPSNSLGSALGQMVANIVGNLHHVENAAENNRKFTYERILDDILYQYIVRRKINNKIIKEGLNIYDLGDDGVQTLKAIKEMMDIETYNFFKEVINYQISLPWNRTFECEIHLD